jgi:hypothetical protein
VAEIRCRPRLSGKSKTANLRTIIRVAADLVGLRFRLLRERGPKHSPHAGGA